MSLLIEDSPALTRTAVAASNLLIGHGLLLRLAALAEALTQQQHEAAALAAAAANGAQAGGLLASSGSGDLLDSDLPPHAEASLAPEQQHGQQGGEQGSVAVAGSEQPAAAEDSVELHPAPNGDVCQQPASPADVRPQQPGTPAEGEAQPAVAAADAALQPPVAVGAQQAHPSSGEDEPPGLPVHAASPGSSALQQAQQAEQAQQQQQEQQQPQQQHSPVAAVAAATQLQQDPRDQALPVHVAPLQAGPDKPVLTSIQLSDCRLVLRYQPGMHPSAASGDGSGHGGASSGLAAGAGIPAATHDFLSVHSDLLAVDVPLLHLQLPLDPEGLVAVAQAEAAVGSTNRRIVGATPTPRSSASSSGGPSPPGGSSSSGWGEASLAAAPPAASQASIQMELAEQAQQVLAEARRLSVFVAAVGQPRHVMLPLLQLPSLRLACTTRRRPGSRGSAARQRFGSASLAALADQGHAAGSPEAAYRLEVACVDLGLHPSQLSMLTSAAQLCQYELAVLGREPAGSGSGGDAESIITVTSAGAFELQRQAAVAATVEAARLAAAAAQQRQAGGQPGAPAAANMALPAEPSSRGSPAATPGRGTTPRPSAETTPAVAAAVAAAAELGSALPQAALTEPAPWAQPQWRLEASIGCLGISLLGATPSSSCLKLEWRDVQASAESLPWDVECMAAARSSPLQQPSGSAKSSASSPAAPDSSSRAPGAAAAPGEQLSLQLSWRQLSLHVLHPRLAYTHPALTPFAFAAALAGDERGRCASWMILDFCCSRSHECGCSPV